VTRDVSVYPKTENGNVLWHMAEDGDDLSIPREIDFSVILPSEDAALKFAVELLKNGQKVSFSEYEGHDELPWQVQAHPFMLPSHENISGYEQLLANASSAFGGRNDGWGCMSQDSAP
jgi:hypothetical protein